MKTRFHIIAVLLVCSFVASACGGRASAADPETSPESSQVGDFASLTDALRSAGAAIETGKQIEQPFFTVPGRIIKVNGADVQVFEYETPEAMGLEASQVAEDGGSIGTNMVSWMESPHFYRAGRMIVLYVGEDQAVVDLLESVLGPQFAGR